METTPRFGLPLLVAGQVQKEIYVSEALSLIDLLLAGSVEGVPVAVPPATPELGRLYRVSDGASGAFSGHEQELAGWSAGGWRFFSPVEGMRLVERTTGLELAYRDGSWTSGSTRASEVVVAGLKVVGARQAAIADAAGGTVVDVQARAALALILAALRTHGLIAS
jgi:hypothetical protein